LSPSAEPASHVVAEPLAPAGLLGQDEIVILAIKPSGWFVPLVSLPVLASAAVVALAAYLIDPYYPSTYKSLAYIFAIVVSLARLTGACWQWLGRTYILTNLRIMSLRGVNRPLIAQAPLTEVREALLAASLPERLAGLGGIYCYVGEQSLPGIAWTFVSHPAEAHEIVTTAINKAKRTHPNGK